MKSEVAHQGEGRREGPGVRDRETRRVKEKLLGKDFSLVTSMPLLVCVCKTSCMPLCVSM